MLRRSHIGLFLGLSLLISAILHAVVWNALPAHAATTVRETKTQENQVEFETLAPPPPPPPVEPPPPPPEPPLAPAPPAPRQPTRKATTPALAEQKPEDSTASTPAPPTAAEGPSTAEPPDPTDTRDARDAVTIPFIKPSISARSAALTVWQPSGPEQPRGRRERSNAEIEQAASLALNQRLKPQAPPPDAPLEIKCNAQQLCEFHGKALDAVIMPDGRFEITEKPNLPMPQLGMAMPNGRPTKPEDIQAERETTLATQFKLPSVAAERARFLKETETLRREKADAYLKQVEADGARSFKTRMNQIWAAPAPTFEQKRRQLFELWEQTSPDELGARYRQLVVQYVRRNLPEHSEAGYPPAELSALNARRQGVDRFSPYAAETVTAASDRP